MPSETGNSIASLPNEGSSLFLASAVGARACAKIHLSLRKPEAAKKIEMNDLDFSERLRPQTEYFQKALTVLLPGGGG